MSELQLINDDCLTWLRTQTTGSIHCCVTDPPYSLGFMGKTWDYEIPSVELWQEVLRVLKPGGTLLSFAGTRTQHRTAVNIEDAGFHIKDMLMWLTGQGFPKAADIGKCTTSASSGRSGRAPKKLGAERERWAALVILGPATPEAQQWDGWKSHALKPAYEPIVLAMKPNDGSYANNALKHGVAGLNIDACRVPSPGENITTHARSVDGSPSIPPLRFHPQETHQRPGQEIGRYPANILHDGSDEVLAGFPKTAPSPKTPFKGSAKRKIGFAHGEHIVQGYADSGSAARFFNALGWSEEGEGNGHPTVKPQALMRWLMRLVCPPDGVVLDPFMGSGTMGVACQAEGFDFIGIERELEYYEIAKRRCKEGRGEVRRRTSVRAACAR